MAQISSVAGDSIIPAPILVGETVRRSGAHALHVPALRGRLTTEWEEGSLGGWEEERERLPGREPTPGEKEPLGEPWHADYFLYWGCGKGVGFSSPPSA